MIPGEDGGRVEQAARWFGADTVALCLEKGYDTPLTRRYAGGIELSGGEWQKVALARSFMWDAALVISHRLSTVRLADRIAVLEGGRIVYGITPR